MKEAARICGVSVATIRRRKAALVEHGATTADDGWTIPVPALVAIGLLDRVTSPDKVPDEHAAPAVQPPDPAAVAPLLEQIATLELRARVAEAVAEERARSLERADRTAEDLRRAMRALEARLSPPDVAPAPTSAPVPADPGPAAPIPPPAPAQAATGHHDAAASGDQTHILLRPPAGPDRPRLSVRVRQWWHR